MIVLPKQPRDKFDKKEHSQNDRFLVIQTAMGDGMLVTPFRKKARAAAVIICH